jgi:hypothetical protein
MSTSQENSKRSKRGAAPGTRRGGRVAGTPNKKTVEKEAILEAAKEAWLEENPDLECPDCPVEVMLLAMKQAWKVGGPMHAFEIAKFAAPYKKAKLQQVDGTMKAQATLQRKWIYVPPKANAGA